MDIFMMDKEEELTADKLDEFIEAHATRIARYNRLMNMYLGDHDILHQDDKEEFKPDNRLVVNFAKYIVDTLNGYFIGHPIKTIHENKDIADRMKLIAKRNSQNDNNAELSKMCSIYGHAYEFMYQDEESNTRVTYMKPDEAFVIYDDTVAQEPLYGVRVVTDADDNISGTIYSEDKEMPFYADDGGGIVINNDETDHYFGDVPIIEYVENAERQSAFENAETLINAYDKALSEKANDVDYFADAYLSILGAELDPDTLDQIRDNRIINMKGGDSEKLIVEFLDKPNADETQENLINRLEKLIFQISMVSNISDENFGTSSGIALKYKLQPMENVALMKERKFNNGMIKRFKMMFNVPGNFNTDKEGYLDIDYVFSRNIPNDIKDEAEAAEKLAGVVSKRTQLSVLSVVDNIQDELDRLEEEDETDTFEQDVNAPFVINEDTEELQANDGVIESELVGDEEKALNGAQITSVLSIIQNIKDGLISEERGRALLVDGLKIDEEAAYKIIK